MLWLKMIRELKENKGAYLGCLIIIAIGLMIFASFSMVIDNITISKEQFYSNQNFAHGFIKLVAYPPAAIERLREIEGIRDIQGRMVKDVRVLFPHREDTVYLRLISVDPETSHPINGMHLIEGFPLNDNEPFIWVDNMFYEANGLNLNDKIEVIAGGMKRDLRVAGVGQSPEFIYALRTAADFYSSPETFGVAFIPFDIMKNFFPQEQAYNDIVFTMNPEAGFEQIKEELERELRPYGLLSIIPRKEQTSHIMITQEIEGLASIALAVPVVFLAIAAMIMYIMLKRIIEQQRGQIGILKAFGYTRREIIFHYLSYGMTIGLLGGIVGGISGIIFSYPFTDLYSQFFNIPGLGGMVSPWYWYLFLSIIMALVFSLIAGYQGSKKVIELEPAEAMRPPAPVLGKKILLEKIHFVWHLLTVQGMMAVRNLARNTGRSVFVFLGIMFCFAIASFTWSLNDLFQRMIFDQYEKVETYDVKVSLNRPADGRGISGELLHFPDVKNVEAMAEIPVTLTNRWHKKDVVVIGISAEGTLYNIIDDHDNRLDPPQSGLFLSERLATILDTAPGSTINLKNLLLPGSDEIIEVGVAGVIPQYVGMNAYMELEALRKLLGHNDLSTSFLLNIEKSGIRKFQDQFLQSHLVAAIDEKEQQLKKLRDLMASMGSMIYIFAVIGVIIGFSIIYSSSIITLTERSRELASMMVLGMTPKEVLSVITFEQWLICGPAMLAGIPLSKLILSEVSREISNDIYTIPVTITNSSFLLATIVTILSIWIAQRAVAGKIRRLSLVEVLKSRE